MGCTSRPSRIHWSSRSRERSWILWCPNIFCRTPSKFWKTFWSRFVRPPPGSQIWTWIAWLGGKGVILFALYFDQLWKCFLRDISSSLSPRILGSANLSFSSAFWVLAYFSCPKLCRWRGFQLYFLVWEGVGGPDRRLGWLNFCLFWQLDLDLDFHFRYLHIQVRKVGNPLWHWQWVPLNFINVRVHRNLGPVPQFFYRSQLIYFLFL